MRKPLRLPLAVTRPSATVSSTATDPSHPRASPPTASTSLTTEFTLSESQKTNGFGPRRGDIPRQFTGSLIGARSNQARAGPASQVDPLDSVDFDEGFAASSSVRTALVPSTSPSAADFDLGAPSFGSFNAYGGQVATSNSASLPPPPPTLTRFPLSAETPVLHTEPFALSASAGSFRGVKLVTTRSDVGSKPGVQDDVYDGFARSTSGVFFVRDSW